MTAGVKWKFRARLAGCPVPSFFTSLLDVTDTTMVVMAEFHVHPLIHASLCFVANYISRGLSIASRRKQNSIAGNFSCDANFCDLFHG